MRQPLLLLAGILWCLLPAANSRAQEKGDAPSRAAELVRQGKPEKALELVEGALAGRPGDKTLLLLRGNLLFRLKRYEESLQAFRAAEKAGGDGAAWEGIASAALAAGRDSEALSAAASALRAGRRSLPLLLAGGRAALRLGRPAEAVPWFRRALLLFPVRVEPRIFLAQALLEAGRPGEAARSAREGMAALGPAEGLLRTLAAALLELGKEGEAADLLEFLARRGKAGPRDLAALGDLDLRLGLPGEALALYAKARAGGLAGKEQAHREALALWSKGDLSKAEKKLLSARPDIPAGWWVEIGRLRLARKDPSGALAAFGRALEKEPESVPAMLWTGKTALGQGRLEGAEKAFRLLLSRGEARKEAYLGLAETWEKRGDLREALAMLRRARAENPSDPEILDRLLRLERRLDSRESK